MYMSTLQLFSYFIFLLFTPRFEVLLCECGVKRRPNWKGIFVQNELHIGTAHVARWSENETSDSIRPKAGSPFGVLLRVTSNE
jgi:hypothetical protein